MSIEGIRQFVRHSPLLTRVEFQSCLPLFSKDPPIPFHRPIDGIGFGFVAQTNQHHILARRNIDNLPISAQSDEAIRAVASGVADGAAVDSLVFEFALARDPSLAEKLRVIHRSPDFGIPPVVISPFTRPQVKADIQTLLLAMSTDPDAKEALASIGVDSFVQINDSAYDEVRELYGIIPTSELP